MFLSKKILDPEIKDLMHTVMDGNIHLIPIMHQLYCYRDCRGFLKWLVLSNIKGTNLLDWLKVNHNNSVLSMVKFIIKSQNKALEEKPIIYGKEWIG